MRSFWRFHAKAFPKSDCTAAFKRRRSILSPGIARLRGIWKKANPALSEIELRASRSLDLTNTDDPGAAVEELQTMWDDVRMPGYDFRHLEAALLRKGLELRRKGRLA